MHLSKIMIFGPLRRKPMPEPFTRRINTDPEDIQLAAAETKRRVDRLEKLRKLGFYKPSHKLTSEEVEQWEKERKEFEAYIAEETKDLPPYKANPEATWKYMSGLDDDPESQFRTGYASLEEWSQHNQEYQAMKDLEEKSFIKKEN